MNANTNNNTMPSVSQLLELEQWRVQMWVQWEEEAKRLHKEQEQEECRLQEQQEKEEQEFEEAIKAEQVRLEEERRRELEEIQWQDEAHREWERKLAEAAKIVPMDEDEELEAGPSNPKERKLGEVVSK